MYLPTKGNGMRSVRISLLLLGNPSDAVDFSKPALLMLLILVGDVGCVPKELYRILALL